MATQTSSLLALWEEAHTRLEDKLHLITEEDLQKTLSPSPNSLGFLLRHIAEVELLFAKNVFGAKDTKIIAKTVIAKHDTGEWVDPKALNDIIIRAKSVLKAIIEKQTDADWETVIETKEFGAKTKAQALGRITSHTAYHAGQIGIILKCGEVKN
jgi:uncharacterized damage-inducible protein DinB